MKKTTFIKKSVSWLIVLSIVAVHACSLTCAAGIYSCCSEIKIAKSESMHACCTDKKSDGKQNNNCQKEHLAYFHTFGKSSISKVEEAAKIFPRLIAERLPLSILLPAQLGYPSLDYVIFHPPPPSGGMQILNSSFLI
ncbi:MAG: hypothetical protein ABIO46_08495 [Chitinophagales bacterium]